MVNAFELNGEITQGALIIGKEQTDKSIYVNKQKIKLSKNGIFVFGINYDKKKVKRTFGLGRLLLGRE